PILLNLIILVFMIPELDLLFFRLEIILAVSLVDTGLNRNSSFNVLARGKNILHVNLLAIFFPMFTKYSLNISATVSNGLSKTGLNSKDFFPVDLKSLL